MVDKIDNAKDIATRLFDAVKKEDIDAINRGLQDFATIGWKMAVVYRFITRKGNKISCIYTRSGDIIFLVDGKFNLKLHKQYMNMFAESSKTGDKSILNEHFKSREEMSSEELSWITSLDPKNVLELESLHDIIKKSA